MNSRPHSNEFHARPLGLTNGILSSKAPERGGVECERTPLTFEIKNGIVESIHSDSQAFAVLVCLH